MLTLFSFHSGIALNIEVDGDIHVDDHHTVEDIGIGQLLLEVVKDKNHLQDMVHSIYRWMKL